MKRRTIIATALTAAVVGTLGVIGITDSMASTTAASLSKTVAPGGNFNLSNFSLQLPIGSPGSPKTISSSQLKGANGFTDAKFFFTDKSDGAMTFFAPESGVHTPHSNYARSELRETGSWASSGSNTLSAQIAVPFVTHSVCVGQVHLLDSQSTKPLVELYYHSNGDIFLGTESSPTGGQTEHKIGNVKVGTKWTYALNVSGTKINLTVNGQKSTFSIPSSFKGFKNYFKAGSYNQSSSGSTTNGAKVKFYSLSITH